MSDILIPDGDERPRCQHYVAFPWENCTVCMQDEIERLRAELDNARSAVKGMSTFLTNEELAWACDTWPWLGEVSNDMASR